MAVGDCNCPMRPNMTYDELMAEICPKYGPPRYCTASKPGKLGWVCSNFLSELDRARTDKRSREYRQKKVSNDSAVPTKVRGRKRKFPAENTYTKGSLEALA